MQTWQDALKAVVTDIGTLCDLLSLDVAQLTVDREQLKQFPLRVPREFVARMKKGNPADPLLLQVLPQAREWVAQSGFVAQPLSETSFTVREGVLHKYHGRVLLIMAGACAVNCRYCFRRHFPYSDSFALKEFEATVDYIANDPTIEEVILSGGEPLLLQDAQLEGVVARLALIPHLKRLRLHTRLPVVIPARVTEALCVLLQQTRLQVVCVMHVNHANEVDDAFSAACAQLQSSGVALLNQAVLLRDVNDSVSSLRSLSERLFDAGVLPYYLHLLDPVAGAAHFDVPLDEAQALMDGLTAQLSGYLVPKLVREVPGESAKQMVTSGSLTQPA